MGVVLYEMLLGRRLFKGETDYDTLTRVKTMLIPPPSQVAASVPGELDTIVMRALERDRTMRYQRATEMVRELDEYLQSVRFSVEQMAEYMGSIYPPEAREEVPDGQSRMPDSKAAQSRGSEGGSKAHLTSPGTPRAIAGVSRATRGGRSERRVLLLAVGLALLVGVGGALLAVGPLKAHSALPGSGANRETEITPLDLMPTEAHATRGIQVTGVDDEPAAVPAHAVNPEPLEPPKPLEPPRPDPSEANANRADAATTPTPTPGREAEATRPVKVHTTEPHRAPPSRASDEDDKPTHPAIHADEESDRRAKAHADGADEKPARAPKHAADEGERPARAQGHAADDGERQAKPAKGPKGPAKPKIEAFDD